MNCPKCGVDNPDQNNFCQGCGESLVSTEEQAPPAAVKTSGVAIAALVLGILTLLTLGLTTLPAIICGIIALVQIGNSKGLLKGKGMAITGIVLPVIVIPLLMAAAIPALVQVRRFTERMICYENLSGLGMAMIVYASDYDEKYPTGTQWCDLLIEYVDVDKRQFICRSAEEGPCNYALNKAALKLGTSAPPDMVLAFESVPGWNQVGGIELLTTDNNRGEGCNVLFVDCHVEFVRPKNIPNLRWTANDSP